jgi:hypothetical protein
MESGFSRIGPPEGGPIRPRPLRADAAALQARVNPSGSRIPQLLVRLDERLDFTRREVDTLLSQRGERFEGLPNEPKAQLFVGDDLTDERLNCFLRHGP